MTEENIELYINMKEEKRSKLHASDKTYGLITALPIIAYLELRQENSLYAMIIIFATLVTIWLAEAYSNYYEKAFKKKDTLTKEATIKIVKDEYAVVASTHLILLPFVLEILGIISLTFAYNLAQFTGIALLFVVGYGLGKHMGRSFSHCILFGLSSASLGFIIVLLKELVK